MKLVNCVILIVAFFITSCNDSSTSVFTSRDYDSECVVGKRYMVYGPKSSNPFEPQAKADVVIMEKLNGYVKYCWTHDYGKEGVTWFTRSCKEFIDNTEINK